MMNRVKLIKSIGKLRQWPASKAKRCMSVKVERASKQSESDEDIDNKPVQFFGSQAAEWRAKDSRSGGIDEALWYQPYVVTGSVAVFLIYFCVLREENDIDQALEGNLFDKVDGLEEVQLTVNYKYNKQNGLDNTAVIKRLNELGVDVKLLEENN